MMPCGAAKVDQRDVHMRGQADAATTTAAATTAAAATAAAATAAAATAPTTTTIPSSSASSASSACLGQWLGEQNVLRLEVRVSQTDRVHVGDRAEAIGGDAGDLGQREVAPCAAATADAVGRPCGGGRRRLRGGLVRARRRLE